MKYKHLVILIIICFVLLLVSCVNPQDTSNGTYDNETSTPDISGDISDNNSNERIELVLGGVWIPEDVHFAVATFNRESKTYQIVIYDYEASGFQDGVQRLQLELITGKGPDIIYDQYGTLTNTDLLLNLYDFIDMDQDLNRSDFFPNMLKVLESPSGKLPLIANCFSIFTMIGTKTAVEHIQTWTPSALLSLVEDSNHLIDPLGPQLTGKVFVMLMLSYAGPEYIDWQNHESNLNSESFINLLNASRLLPEPKSEEDIISSEPLGDPMVLMAHGKQLLDLTNIGLYSYQIFSDIVGDIVALGIPTTTGGAHILEQHWLMGINANTKYADGAWEFLREFLLPTAQLDPWMLFPFPLRIDLYDELITELMIPHMEEDASGNMVEIPWEIELRDENGDIITFNVYSLTDASAMKMRNIVESAEILVRRIHRMGLWDLLEGDLDSFFDENRSAEDTARVMQSRVQIYLSERS
ncbi:MAG: hypothetical protein LBC71_06310 [Oscillospiraceae bacterium]|jgi:hypothetical protein|nr:hypothetical protein [Oscillospiraceae bacterium]